MHVTAARGQARSQFPSPCRAHPHEQWDQPRRADPDRRRPLDAKYERDGSANDPIWRELRQQDEQAARRLVQQLEQFAQQGKLRAK